MDKTQRQRYSTIPASRPTGLYTISKQTKHPAILTTRIPRKSFSSTAHQNKYSVLHICFAKALFNVEPKLDTLRVTCFSHLQYSLCISWQAYKYLPIAATYSILLPTATTPHRKYCCNRAHAYPRSAPRFQLHSYSITRANPNLCDGLSKWRASN